MSSPSLEENSVLEAVYAVLALRRADLHSASAVHIRKALEFAIVAQWIHVTPNGLDAFLHESRRNTEALIAEAKAANVLLPLDVAESLAEAAAAAPDEAKVMRHFNKVSDTFGVGSGVYMMYRSLSGHCHPNVGAIVQHLEDAPDSTGGVAIRLHGGTPNSAHYFTSPPACSGQPGRWTRARSSGLERPTSRPSASALACRANSSRSRRRRAATTAQRDGTAA
jgi:hypothetical protein